MADAPKQKSETKPPAAESAAAADLALLSAAARQAGEIGLRFFGRNPQVWIKEGNSPVSEADFAVDRFLKRELLAARPDYGWISEETADDRPPQAYQRSFIVDPIDGTRGFIGNNPQWCVSVAVVEHGRPLAGVLDCPALGEHYSAASGCGAKLNGAAPAPAAAAPGRRVSCGKADWQRLPAEFAQAAARAPHIPSLAYRLALLARGRLDLVLVRPGCHDWDIAAADIILQNSGAALADASGQPVFYGRPPFAHGFLAAMLPETANILADIVSPADLG